MRLLHTTNFTFKEFNEDNLEPYAILSHTWSQNEHQPELTYQPFVAGDYSVDSYGWQKVEDCCRIARARGFKWVWIDSISIDKSSSAELTETINSMYQWYERSTECYVFLDDVDCTQCNHPHSNGRATTKFECFRNSRWFYRGWTLQELLAPPFVMFFDTSRRLDRNLGTRTTMAEWISGATGINIEYLTGSSVISQASVAQRMSWASGRKTTRVEDIAYSLLGIFDVNMALLYGEGSRAFQRLQQAIIQQNDDESIFAWGLALSEHECAEANAVQGSVLADHPDSFALSGNVMPIASFMDVLGRNKPPTQVTNRGIVYAMSFFFWNIIPTPPSPKDYKKFQLACRMAHVDGDKVLTLVTERNLRSRKCYRSRIDIHKYKLRHRVPVLFGRSEYLAFEAASIDPDSPHRSLRSEERLTYKVVLLGKLVRIMGGGFFFVFLMWNLWAIDINNTSLVLLMPGLLLLLRDVTALHPALPFAFTIAYCICTSNVAPSSTNRQNKAGT